MRKVASLLLLLICFPVYADVKVKGDKAYPPHKKIVLKAQDVTSKSAQFLWEVSGDADILEAGDTLYVWAPPGKYVVKLIAIDFDAKKVERASFNFNVDGTVPPNPNPIPPDPTPVPPRPDDDLTKAVRAAFSSETAADKKQLMLSLAIVYETAAKSIRDSKPDTMGKLWKAIEAGEEAAKIKGKLLGVQAVIKEKELSALPSRSSDKLDDALRTVIVRAFERVAVALREVVK